MATYRIVSADSHFVEPPQMWTERIDARFRDHAPHTIKNYKSREAEFFLCENISPVAVAGFFGSGKTSEELPEHIKRGFDAAPGSVWDPAERLKEQDRDGVSGEILYTSMGMLLYGLDDAGLRAACFSAFNDWAGEYCSYDPQRLIGTGTVTLEDVSEGVKELERCAKKGLARRARLGFAARGQALQRSRLRSLLGGGTGSRHADLIAYTDRQARPAL